MKLREKSCTNWFGQSRARSWRRNSGYPTWAWERFANDLTCHVLTAGYWQLIEAGRKLTIPPLPPLKKGTPARAFISPYVKPEHPLEDKVAAALIETESQPANRIIVADTLHGAHPLIRETRKLLETGFVDSYGRAFAKWSEKPRQVLNVKVSKTALHRALRIMDALLKAIQSRGGEIEVRDRETLCIMNHARVRFDLWEKVKRSERELTAEEREKSYVPDRWIYTPTGEFMFTIYEWVVGRKSWKDKKHKPMEDQLNDILWSASLRRLK